MTQRFCALAGHVTAGSRVTVLVKDRMGPNLIALIFQIKSTSVEYFTPPPAKTWGGGGVAFFLTFGECLNQHGYHLV